MASVMIYQLSDLFISHNCTISEIDETVQLQVGPKL